MESEKYELYEYAKSRIKQKKRLYYHFVLLCLGSVFLFVANKWLSFYPDTSWWKWVVTVWVFIFILHAIKIFITNSFMNKNWERNEIDKLIVKQSKKVEQIHYDLDNSKSTTE